MPRHTRTLVAVTSAAAVLAVPAMAQAAAGGKVVFMGTPPSVAKAMQKAGADANDFFPRTITVQAGQKVTFAPVGFHTVDFPARGGNPLGLIVPSGQKVDGASDAAGAPFWFNGQDNVGFTPDLVMKPLFGKSATYDGTKRVESGLPLSNKPKPFAVTFKKAGSFTYFCDVHPGMKATVRVVAKGKKVASAKADAKAITTQAAAALKSAKTLQKTEAPTGTVFVGAAGPHGVESFAFYPSQVTVPAGTTLTFKMSPQSYDDHTATTGPGDPEKEPSSYLGKLAASFEAPTIDPAAVYPSEQPPAPGQLSPALHGNGFWNSGVMDTSSATPLPGSSAVTFSAPGTYQFYCLIHPFMHATVTVQ